MEMARNNVTFVAIVAVVCLGSLFMLANPLSLGTYDPPSSGHGSVTHLVLFQYKDDAAASVIAQVNLAQLSEMHDAGLTEDRQTSRCWP